MKKIVIVVGVVVVIVTAWFTLVNPFETSPTEKERIELLEYSYNSKPESTGSEMRHEPAGNVDDGAWQTYKNDAFGFQLQIPKSWKQERTSQSYHYKNQVDFNFRDSLGDQSSYSGAAGESYDLTISFTDIGFSLGDSKDVATDYVKREFAELEMLAKRYEAESGTDVKVDIISVGGHPAVRTVHYTVDGKVDTINIDTLYQSVDELLSMNLYLSGKDAEVVSSRLIETLAFFPRNAGIPTCLGYFENPKEGDVLMSGDAYTVRWNMPEMNSYHLKLFLEDEKALTSKEAIRWNWAKDMETEAPIIVGEYFVKDGYDMVPGGFVPQGKYRFRLNYDFSSGTDDVDENGVNRKTGCLDEGDIYSPVFEIR